jgi:DNA-nicking Smr family endonuclease
MKPARNGTVYRPFDRLGQRLPSAPPDGEHKPAPEPMPRHLDDEDELFEHAMRGVVPLRNGPDRIAERSPALPAVPDEDAEAYAELKALVEGRVRFQLSDSDEYLEGAVDGLDSRVLRKLRSGGYTIQDYLDLHGQTRAEAKAALTRFVERCGAGGKRSVLIVHGRGLNSKDQIPVLKHSVAHWLVRGRLARWTLCYCTARSVDGGAGALYVLLRARPAEKG